MAEKRKMIDAFAETLVELAKENSNIIAVTADLTTSTGLGKFSELFPERFFNLGVAEQDAASTAAGLAGLGAEGKPVFWTTFATFADIALAQIVQSICSNMAPVKMVFTHMGVNVGPDGGSHQPTRCIATLRPIPNLKIAVPADYYETKAVIRRAVEEPGPVCVLLPREAGEIIYDEKVDFYFGESKYHYSGFRRANPQILLCACGLMVSECLKAAEIIQEEEGISAAVLNVSSIKPMGLEKFIDIFQAAERIFTVEEQSVIGGLGGAVCEFLAEQRNCPPVRRLGIPDVFGQSGTCRELWEFYGLTAGSIAEITEAFYYK